MDWLSSIPPGLLDSDSPVAAVATAIGGIIAALAAVKGYLNRKQQTELLRAQARLKTGGG